mmetsp:Transcript_100742/g.291256  ORF Transcript_100742/g.291256 Transcript_100742/m.291256 type:complete len:290 (-) Transcript_100742:1005-1874(-)
MKLATSVASTQSFMVNGWPVNGFVCDFDNQSSNAALSKRYPSGVFTGSCINVPENWHMAIEGTKDSSVCPRCCSQFSAGISGGMSSSPESPSSSSLSSASASSGALEETCFCFACMPNMRFLLWALPFAFFQLLFLVAFLAAAWLASVSGTTVTAKANACMESPAAREYGNRAPCSDVSRRLSRSWLSTGKTSKADNSVLLMTSQYGPCAKSTLMDSLTSNSSMLMWLNMLGTRQICTKRSESRIWDRKTLMLNVTTTNVCNTAFKFWNSMFPGPQAGLSKSAGKMLCT